MNTVIYIDLCVNLTKLIKFVFTSFPLSTFLIRNIFDLFLWIFFLEESRFFLYCTTKTMCTDRWINRQTQIDMTNCWRSSKRKITNISVNTKTNCKLWVRGRWRKVIYLFFSFFFPSLLEPLMNVMNSNTKAHTHTHVTSDINNSSTKFSPNLKITPDSHILNFLLSVISSNRVICRKRIQNLEIVRVLARTINKSIVLK